MRSYGKCLLRLIVLRCCLSDYFPLATICHKQVAAPLVFALITVTRVDNDAAVVIVVPSVGTAVVVA